MNNQPILFVHGRDGNSLKILETLKQMKKDDLCRIVNIDGKQRHELPDFLKSVPTLYVPQTKDVYIGKDIYAYIAKPVVSRREVPVSQSPGAAAPAGDVAAWSFSGAGALTESYGNWQNPSQFTGDSQLNFSFLGPMTNSPAPPEPGTKQSYDGNKQGRNDDISSRMEQMKKMRDSEFKGIARQ
jgi:hypothetical protein